MIKAVFMDYTGTIIQEKGKDLEEIVTRIWKNSTLETPKDVLKYWWSNLKILEEKSFGDAFLTEDEIVDRLLHMLDREAGLDDDFSELHKLCQRYWMYAPVFEDVEEFFEKCTLPVYVITNNGACYVQECMERNHLNPAGIVSGEMVRAYKPHKELFQKALEISGCRADEVIHIGDSVTSDVKGAYTAGITPVLIDRIGKNEYSECKVIHRLTEALSLLE